MRAKLLADLAVGDPRDRRRRDGHRELRRGRAAAAGLEHQDHRRSRSTRCMREAPDARRSITKLARGVLDARRRGRWASTQENLVALAGDAPLLRHLREGDAELHRQAVARHGGVRRAGVRRSQQRARRPHGSTGPRSRRGLDARPRAGQGRPRAHVLPRRHHLRAEADATCPRSTPASSCGAATRAVDDPARRHASSPTAAGRSGSARKVLVTLEALNTTPPPRGRARRSAARRLRAGQHAASRPPSARSWWPATTRWDHRTCATTAARRSRWTSREGAHRFSYTARATTPGTFLAAPAKAEEMYSPETFGRSSSQTVVIE